MNRELAMSANSWMLKSSKDLNNEDQKSSLKNSMRSTASKLGRKLIAMDNETEVKKVTVRSLNKASSSKEKKWNRF